jgi:hypothetical protein
MSMFPGAVYHFLSPRLHSTITSKSSGSASVTTKLLLLHKVHIIMKIYYLQHIFERSEMLCGLFFIGAMFRRTTAHTAATSASISTSSMRILSSRLQIDCVCSWEHGVLGLQHNKLCGLPQAEGREQAKLDCIHHGHAGEPISRN